MVASTQYTYIYRVYLASIYVIIHTFQLWVPRRVLRVKFEYNPIHWDISALSNRQYEPTDSLGFFLYVYNVYIILRSGYLLRCRVMFV